MSKKVKHWEDLTPMGDTAYWHAWCKQSGNTDLVSDRSNVTCRKCINIATKQGFKGVGVKT